MNFSDKINHIFNVLGCSNAAIARLSKIDPSLISRFRTGSRQPKATSVQFKQFCKGIVNYAQKNELTEKLRQECNLSGTGNPDDEINAFLNENVETVNKFCKKAPHVTYVLFSEKLNILMNRLDISNIRLARALNVDTSLVSRFRNGLRTPPKNSSLTVNLCSYLYKAVKMNGYKHEFFELIGTPITEAQINEDEIKAIFINWLFDEDGTHYTGDVDSFLEKLDSMNAAALPLYPLSEKTEAPDILQDIKNEYIGTDGLRKAVLRFLGTVATTDRKHIIKLYSNKKLNWLSSDPVFLQKWAALMYAVLRNKNQIKIIHYIERNLSEMLIGIEKWIPLYMSGLIEGFFCKSEADTKFSHTIFVAPETAGIYGSFVSGTEDSGIYQYAGTPDRVQYYEKQFDALLSMSQPLVQVFRKDKTNDFLFCKGEISKAQGNMKRLLQAPSLATVPTSLLERMLRRADVEQKELACIMNVHENCVRHLERDLKNGHVMEYVVFPEDETLFAGNVRLNLYDAFTEKAVYYTPEEYSEHIKAIIALLEKSIYEIAPLPESPFENIQILVKENSGAMVQKTNRSITVFRFSHPSMCKALSEYIDAIGQRNKLQISGKEELIKYLGKYLR